MICKRLFQIYSLSNYNSDQSNKTILATPIRSLIQLWIDC